MVQGIYRAQDDRSLTPPSLFLQLQIDDQPVLQPILYPIDCSPPSSNPLQLFAQLQAALFHILWTASNSTGTASEAAHLFSIAKFVADWTDNLADDLLALTSPNFLPRTFAVLQTALARAQGENLFFPEFFTHIDGLQVFSFSQSFTTISANFPCNAPVPSSHHDH